MIQRIQSIYLLLASALVGLLFLFPFATSSTVIESSKIFGDQDFDIMDHNILFGLLIAGAAIALIAIFFFGNRKTQSLVVYLSLLLVSGGAGFIIGYFFKDPAAQQMDQLSAHAGIGVPVLMVVFLVLALRAIAKDEKMVRSSYDRLR